MFYKYGRINRPTYFLSLAMMATVYGLALAFIPTPPRISEVLALFIVVPRLHDIGKTGWWAGAAILVEFVVVFAALPFALAANQEDILLIVGGLLAIVFLVLMVWLGCVPGQEGVNAYGEPPPPGLSFKTYRLTKAPSETVADAF